MSIRLSFSTVHDGIVNLILIFTNIKGIMESKKLFEYKDV